MEKPLEHGEAMRQALAHAQSRSPPRPATQKPRTEHLTGDKRVWEGLRILKPTRPGAEVRGRFRVEFDNPQRRPSEVSIFNLQERSVEPCHLEYGGTSTVLSRASRSSRAPKPALGVPGGGFDSRRLHPCAGAGEQSAWAAPNTSRGTSLGSGAAGASTDRNGEARARDGRGRPSTRSQGPGCPARHLLGGRGGGD